MISETVRSSLSSQVFEITNELHDALATRSTLKNFSSSRYRHKDAGITIDGGRVWQERSPCDAATEQTVTSELWCHT